MLFLLLTRDERKGACRPRAFLKVFDFNATLNSKSIGHSFSVVSSLGRDSHVPYIAVYAIDVRCGRSNLARLCSLPVVRSKNSHVTRKVDPLLLSGGGGGGGGGLPRTRLRAHACAHARHAAAATATAHAHPHANFDYDRWTTTNANTAAGQSLSSSPTQKQNKWFSILHLTLSSF